MLKPLQKFTPDWYKPLSEEDSDNPTRFKLQPLTPPQRESVMEFDGEYFRVPPKNYDKVLAMGLVDWENFGTAAHTLAGHASIPGDIRAELALEILARSRMNEEEAKNSSSQ